MANLISDKLALLGGNKIINKSFKRYNTIGQEELSEVQNVINSGVLSKYLGAWSEDFYGGEKVKEFENAWKDYFDVKHAVSMNSLTSGLIAAIGALGIEPGDEVIVSPWTMCATATAILHWNAIPVFADIDSLTFCLDPKSVEKNISPYTKAVISVDIFGQSADMVSLSEICNKYNLKLISDTAQAIGAKYYGKFAGTRADIGGFSLNYHKHIHTGEGGMMITNDDEIAERLKLIRNHAEAVVGQKGYTNLSNMLGYNFRLGEIECAIGIIQLRKLNDLLLSRQNAASFLTKHLTYLPGLKTPFLRNHCTHVYYIYPLVLDLNYLGVTREKIYNALKAEGVPNLILGYQNIHLLPLYQQKIAYGTSGFPWNSEFCHREISYEKGICPIAEELHQSSFLGFGICMLDLSESDLKLIVAAFEKVWENLDCLYD